MADHKHGSMDTKPQEKTYAGFIGIVTKAVIVVILLLVFVAIVNG